MQPDDARYQADAFVAWERRAYCGEFKRWSDSKGFSPEERAQIVDALDEMRSGKTPSGTQAA